MRHTLLERATMPLHLSHVSSPFAHRILQDSSKLSFAPPSFCAENLPAF